LFKEEVETPNEIIELLCKLLQEKGYVNEEYVNDSIEREKLSPTTIGGEIAIPHGHPKNVLKQGIAMAILKKPILWKHQMVSVVFMLSIKDTQSEDIKHLFEEIILLGEEESIIEGWKKKTSKNDFYENM
jgi:activator of the mannose operon (transcriptional antiterminator)